MTDMLEHEHLEELERRIQRAEEANEAARRELANRRSELSPGMRQSLWMLAVVVLVLTVGAGGCGVSCSRATRCWQGG
jgi:hypothetical protein